MHLIDDDDYASVMKGLAKSVTILPADVLRNSKTPLLYYISKKELATKKMDENASFQPPRCNFLQ